MRFFQNNGKRPSKNALPEPRFTGFSRSHLHKKIPNYAACLAASGGRVKAPSVLQATNTEQAALIVVVPDDILVAEVHVPVVGVVSTALRSTTPPVAVVADIVEIAIRIAVAARQGGKAAEALTQLRSGFIRKNSKVFLFALLHCCRWERSAGLLKGRSCNP